MSNLKSVKTNFTAGQISRSLYGRGDLGLYENGARTLENVIIYPTAASRAAGDCGILTGFRPARG